MLFIKKPEKQPGSSCGRPSVNEFPCLYKYIFTRLAHLFY